MRLKPIPDPWQPSGPPGAQFFQEYPALVLSSVCSVQKRMLVTSYLILSSIKPGPATKQQNKLLSELMTKFLRNGAKD